MAAIGRRVNTLCQGEASLGDQLTLFQVYHNFVVPPASLRQRLLVPESTHGRGSAQVWRPCTPAMAAGVTDHVLSLKEVLHYRVPPWQQAQTRSCVSQEDERAVERTRYVSKPARRGEREAENLFRGLMTG